MSSVLITNARRAFSARWEVLRLGQFKRRQPPKAIVEGVSLLVDVRDNNVDQALRALKKKMQREGLFREMKARRAYEKPSEKRAREKADAIRRSRKLARKQAQREGLLPAPKKKAIRRQR
jgi:small subunit ribosomal protein S21